MNKVRLGRKRLCPSTSIYVFEFEKNCITIKIKYCRLKYIKCVGFNDFIHSGCFCRRVFNQMPNPFGQKSNLSKQ